MANKRNNSDSAMNAAIFRYGAVIPMNRREFAYIGRDAMQNYKFADLREIYDKPKEDSAYEILTIGKGTFISDGREIFLMNPNSIPSERRALDSTEYRSYCLAYNQRLADLLRNPNKK